MSNLDDLVETINQLPKKGTLFIAIDGRGGSGKSTLAERLQVRLHNVSIIHLDDISYPINDQDIQWLIVQMIKPLKLNKVTHSKYNGEYVKPGGFVIIEGVLALHDMLNPHYDFRIWIECPPEIGLARGVKREIIKDGIDNTLLWQEKWLPLEKLAFTEQNPHSKADYIIDSTKSFV